MTTTTSRIDGISRQIADLSSKRRELRTAMFAASDDRRGSAWWTDRETELVNVNQSLSRLEGLRGSLLVSLETV